MPPDGRAVLVVDDDRLNRALLTKLLEREGYRVRSAVDGRQALAAVAEEDYQAVLLDIVMPEIDGVEVLRTLKGHSRWWRIPVIVISATEEVDDVVACLELGADDYVQKPFDPVLLRARLNACLARRRFHDLEVAYQKMLDEQATELDELRAARSPVPPGPGPLGGAARRAEVAVVVAALADPGGLTGDVRPAEVVHRLAKLHGMATRVTDRHGGVAAASAVGAATSVYGQGDQLPNGPAAAAVAAAAALDVELTADPPHPLGWGIGVAAGPALVASLQRPGAEPWFVAVGGVVERAQHLAAQAAAGTTGLGAVWLDATVHAAVAGSIHVDVVLASPPGIPEPDPGRDQAYRLVRRASAAGGFTPGQPVADVR